MKNYSIWQDFKSKVKCQKVSKNMETDVLIVGGGITGISILYQLKGKNINTILIEANKCGYGVTSRSTAKITYLQEKIYMNIRKYNDNLASLYLNSQRWAVNKLSKIIKDNNINCDLYKTDSYIFTVNKNNVSKLWEEYDFLKKNGVKVEKDNLDNNVKSALKVQDTFVFHPLKFIEYWKNIYQDNIFENSRLESFKKVQDYYICKVNNKIIKAKTLVLALHYPYFLMPFMMPLKSHIETSFIGAIRVNNFINKSVINIDKPTISYRYHTDNKDNYFIYLENSKKSSNINNIKDYFNNLNKKFNFNYVWSNKDIITNDYIPWIGSLNNDNSLLIATGYNTWGITNATLAGEVIKDIILNKDNPYIELLNPRRSINGSKILRLPIDISCSALAYLKSNKHNINNKKIIYKKVNNITVAKLNNKDQEIVVKYRCPHMKCGLVYNDIENTWDCLLHGSRFDINGKIIEGPSNKDITINKNN